MERLAPGQGVVRELHVSAGRTAVVMTTPEAPAEVMALEGSTLRPLSAQNEKLLAGIELGALEGIEFASRDGTDDEQQQKRSQADLQPASARRSRIHRTVHDAYANTTVPGVATNRGPATERSAAVCRIDNASHRTTRGAHESHDTFAGPH